MVARGNHGGYDRKTLLRLLERATFRLVVLLSPLGEKRLTGPPLGAIKLAMLNSLLKSARNIGEIHELN